MFDWSEWTLFLYILARMTGFVVFNPILGRSNLPGLFKAGVILILSVFVKTITDSSVSVPVGTIELALRMLLELGLGFLLGLAVHFYFYIPQLAGTMIDTQMGMTMSQMYDPGSQVNMTVSSVLLNALMTMLFFAANGHHTLLRIMITSGNLVPYGAASFGAPVLNSLLELFVEATILGVKLCLPILAAEMVGQIGMGVLMKVIPQINVFTINIELKIIIGLILLLMLTAPFSEFLLQAERSMLDALSRLLALTG